MKRISCLFDYFKIAFSINKENKGLYKPQIILIMLKTCLIIVTGIVIYDYVSLLSIVDEVTEQMIFAKVLSTGGLYFLIFIVSIFVKIAFEAGLYSMYKDCIKEGALKANSFTEGIKTYFLKFLIADILMLIAWIIMLLPYIIIGFVTMFAGFIIIPIIISIFTAMWKVSIVIDGSGVVDSLKKSFRFAKLNFWPLSFLIIIQNAFSSLANGGGSSGGSNLSNFNQNTSSVQNPTLGNGVLEDKIFSEIPSAMSSFDPSADVILSYVRLGFFILIPVISIAVVISSLIKMVFDVFFSLSVFVMYTENLDAEKIDLVKEVL